MTATAPGAPSTIRSSMLSGAAALIGLGLLSGCYTEGGSGFSTDQHAYVSTAWQPKTITLVDTRTSQSFWSIDVPVGKKLVIQFRENASSPDAAPGDATPDMMLWDLMAPDDDFGPLANQIPVPPKAARRIDWVLRATPELPESMGGAAPQPAPKASADAMKK